MRAHDGVAAHTGAGVRKPPQEETALGGRGTMPRDRASRVKQPSDDQDDRLWGFNVWRHLYFQWLGYSKNTTPHNLNVSSSYLKAMRQTDLRRLESPRSYQSRNCFELLVEHHRICKSAYVKMPGQGPTSATLHTIAIEDSSWLLCNGWCSATNFQISTSSIIGSSPATHQLPRSSR